MGSIKKNLLLLDGKPVLVHTLEALEASSLVKEIVLVVAEDDIKSCKVDIVEAFGLKKVSAVVAGGAERQDSVTNGLAAVSDGVDIIAVHDGARAFVTRKVIEETIIAAYENGAAICAVPLKDTIKELSESGKMVRRTVPRESLCAVQTPQAFRPDIIRRAYEEAAEDGFFGTDSSSLVERLGIEVAVTSGDYENIKITTPEDLDLAARILERRALEI